MKNVIVFPGRKEKSARTPREIEGATLFIHLRKSSLIAHLAHPRADRIANTGRTNNA